MFMSFLLLLALAVCSFVADTVYESAQNGGGTIISFGRTMGEPGLPEGIWILCGMSAVASLAVVTVIARGRGRWLERRTVAELGGRVDTLLQQEAGDATRARLLHARVDELQTSVDELAAKRDEAYEEMRHARERVKRLNDLAHQQKAALQATADNQDRSIVSIPEVTTELMADEPVGGGTG